MARVQLIDIGKATLTCKGMLPTAGGSLAPRVSRHITWGVLSCSACISTLVIPRNLSGRPAGQSGISHGGLSTYCCISPAYPHSVEATQFACVSVSNQHTNNAWLFYKRHPIEILTMSSDEHCIRCILCTCWPCCLSEQALHHPRAFASEIPAIHMWTKFVSNAYDCG